MSEMLRDASGVGVSEQTAEAAARGKNPPEKKKQILDKLKEDIGKETESFTFGMYTK